MINIAVKPLNLISADAIITTVPTLKQIPQKKKVPYGLPKPTLINLNNAISLQVSCQRSQEMTKQNVVERTYML
jgi:hypothetical protein